MLETGMPKVSVCIPAYNAALYIKQAVESALAQSYRDFEIVIVDNCSTDETVSLIDSLIIKNSGRIRLFRNTSNIGLVANLNKCLSYAEGRYIKFLCADDLLLEGCLEKMADGLDMYPSVKLVTCGRKLVDADGNNLGIKRYSMRTALVPGNRVISKCLFGGNYIGEPSAVMFRKADVKSPFREDMPQLSDIDMWFQLLEGGALLNLSEPLCVFRSHPAQMTHTNVKLGLLVADNIKLFESYSKKSYLEIAWISVWKYKLLMTYRVWVSRAAIPKIMRDIVLVKYASPMIYRLMPLMELLVWIKKFCVHTKKT